MGLVSHPKDINERRREARRMVHKRHPALIIAELSLPEGLKSTIIDVATHGLGLCTTHKLFPDMTITIEVAGHDYNWKIPVKVVWCQRMPLSGHVLKEEEEMCWRIGVQVMSEEEEVQNVMQHLFNTL